MQTTQDATKGVTEWRSRLTSRIRSPLSARAGGVLADLTSINCAEYEQVAPAGVPTTSDAFVTSDSHAPGPVRRIGAAVCLGGCAWLVRPGELRTEVNWCVRETGVRLARSRMLVQLV